jgi:hypothetical protein
VTATQITLEQARQSWVAEQRLAGDATRVSSLAEAVGDIGWIPLPTPVAAYLALFARGLIDRRGDLDARLGELVVVPGPKGSSWLVPLGDAPIARAFAVADHASREARVAATTTLPTRDLETARELLKATLTVPTSLEEIRAKLPDWAMRSLGAPGRKAGMPTLASLVLRSMWVNGEIHRVARDGRLDAGAVTWSMDPRPRVVPSAAEAVGSIAPRWISAHGPVTARAFANAFGTPAGRAMPAIRAAQPAEIVIEGLDETFLARANFVPPELRALPVRLLPARDPLTEVHLPMLASPDAVRGATTRAGTAAPAILLGGMIVGTWAYDPGTGEIHCTPLEQAFDAAQSDEIAAEARRLAAFVRSELAALPMHVIASLSPRARGGATPPSELIIEL